MLHSRQKDGDNRKTENRKRIKLKDFPDSGGWVHADKIEGNARNSVRKDNREQSAENADKNSACKSTVNQHVVGIRTDQEECEHNQKEMGEKRLFEAQKEQKRD